MKMLKRIFKGESGMALPLALVLLLVGALFVVPALSLLSTTLNANQVVDQSDLELYAADAGIEKAIWHLENDEDFDLPEEGSEVEVDFEETLNSKNVSVTIENAGDLGYKIISEASGQDGNTTVTAYVVLASEEGGAAPTIFDFAAASLDGDVNMTGSTWIYSEPRGDGDIFANLGDVNLVGSSIVEGDAGATGEINITGSANIQGEEVEGAEQLDVTAFLEEVNALITQYQAVTQDVSCPSVLATGDWIISTGGTYTDVPTIERDLKIQGSGTVIITGPICVGRDIKISGSTNIIFQGPVEVGRHFDISGSGDMEFQDTVYVGNDFKTTGSKDISVQAPLYVVDEIKMTGSAFRGGGTLIAGGDIQMTGSGQLNDVGEIPFLISANGEITFTGSAAVSAVVCAPNGSVRMTGSTWVYGCLVGEDLNLTGSSRIEYPTGISDREDLPGGGGSGGETSGSTGVRAYHVERERN